MKTEPTTTNDITIPATPSMVPFTRMSKITEGRHPATVLNARVMLHFNTEKIEVDVNIHNGPRHQHYLFFNTQKARAAAAKQLNEAFSTEFTDDAREYTPVNLRALVGQNCVLDAKEETWVSKKTGQTVSAIRTGYLAPYSETSVDLAALQAKEAPEKTEIAF